MKKKIVLAVLAISLFIAGHSFSQTGIIYKDPFLVCNSYPTTVSQPTYFMVTMDGGTAVNSPALVNTDNSVQLHYDVTSLAVGNHSVTVTACNIWGCSAATSPFVFTKSVPTTPTGIVISQQ